MFEQLLVALVICAAAMPILALMGWLLVPQRMGTLSVALVWSIFPLVVIGAAVAYRQPVEQPAPVTFRPIEVQSNGYVGSDSCRNCHPHHHATWSDSFHRTMTQVATPSTMLGSLELPPTRLEGVTFRIRAQDDEVWADMEMPSPQAPDTLLRVSRRIVMTTGSHHMQLLWYPYSDDNRLLGMFPFVYLMEQQRWIPRGAAFLQPDYSLNDELGRWNQTCSLCHATFARMRPAERKDPQTGETFLDANAFDTQVAELGIACEACHGPGTLHVEANQNPARRYLRHLLGDDDPTIVNPAKLPHSLNSHVCGQCHSVQCTELTAASAVNGYSYRPGMDLEQSSERFIFRVQDGLQPREEAFLKNHPDFISDHYWSDGMVRISGREYNGLLESACYQRGGLSCLSCHQMHQAIADERPTRQWSDDQLQRGKDDDRACVECHAQFHDLAVREAHTHHGATSAGSNCYNCHMTYTTYGLLKAIRSHQIDSPSVHASVATGRPNACNQCHLDQTLQWTAEYLRDWYGIKSPELSVDERTIAASVIWLLRGDAGQRAVMAWSLGWRDAQEASGTDWMGAYLAQLLDDPYAAVRMIAARSLRTLTGFERLEYDFVAPDEQRAAASQRAVAQWAEVRHRPSERLLIDEQGELMRATFQRLLKERNDRPMVLVE